MEFFFILILFLLLALLVLPIIAIAGRQEHSRRIEELEKELKELKHQLSYYQLEKNKQPAKEEIKKEAPASPVKAPENIAPKESVRIVKEPVIVDSGLHFQAPEENHPKAIPAKPDFIDKMMDQTRSMTSSEWEALIGGKVLNRIGALAVIIGVGFFLKYAFDNNWITETMRVLIGIATGGLLLFGGHHYNKKGFAIFSRGLTGAGIAILYLSVYASFNYYHLVSQVIAFGMMVAVTAISFWQAFKYNSLVISIFGWLGGTLTPFLLSTGQANEVGLLLYVAFLAAGLLLISLKKEKWFILEPLGLFTTILIYSMWNWSHFMPPMCAETVPLLCLLWGIFIAYEIKKIVSLQRKITLIDQAVSLANGAFFYISLYNVVDSSYHQLMGGITVLVGAAYLGIYLLTRKQRPAEKYLLTRYLISIVSLAVCASFIQYTGFQIPTALAIESFALTWIAKRDKNMVLYLAALVLLGLSILGFICQRYPFYSNPDNYRFLLNMRSGALIAILLSAFGSGALLSKNGFKFYDIVKPALTCTWIIVLFTLVTTETSDSFDYLWYHSSGSIQLFYRDNFVWVLILEWAILSLLLFHYSFKRQLLPHLYSSYVILALALCFSAVKGFLQFSPLAMFLPVFNIRAAGLLLVGVVIWVLLNAMQKANHKDVKIVEKIAGVSIVLLLFILLTADTRDIFERRISLFTVNDTARYLTGIVYLMQLCLSGIWLVYSITLMVVGIYKRNFGIRIMSIVLFGITILKIFFYDLSNLDTLHRIFSFIGLGLTLLAVSYLYHKYKHLILPEKTGVKNQE